MNIVVVGLGNIGSYFFTYLKKNKNILFNKTNTIPNILYVSANESAYKIMVTGSDDPDKVLDYKSNFMKKQIGIKISFLPNASSSARGKIKNKGERIANIKIGLKSIFLKKK